MCLLDYTAAFFWKRKGKSEEFHDAFALLGSSEVVEEPVLKCLQKFVCYVYSKL